MPSTLRLLKPRGRLLAAVLGMLVLGWVGSVPAQAAGPGGAGIQLHVLWQGVDQREMESQFDRAAAANAGIVRVDVGWASLEPQAKGRWSAHHLERLDAVVDAAQARGVELLLTLADSPCWASGAPESLKADCRGAWWGRGVQRYLPRDPADYGDALALLARRYGTRVAGWEMWNEPNQEAFSPGPAKARRYAGLVRAAYRRAKPAAGSVPLIAGALSESDVEFLEDLYDAGIHGSFDAFSIHPYSHDASPLATGAAGEERWSFVRGVPAVRATMVRHGDDKPLWLTELGWSTTSVRGAEAWRNGVSEAAQAAYVTQALAQVESWDYVPYAIYYNLLDLADRSRERADHFGLARRDGRAKPALQAFRVAAGAMGGAPRPAASSPHPAARLSLGAPGIRLARASEVRPGRIPAVVVRRRPGRRVTAIGATSSGARAHLTLRRATGRGRLVRRIRLGATPQGRFRTSIAVGRLPRGRYLVRLETGGTPAPSVILLLQ